MSNTSIQLKKSGVTGNTPSGLAFGEVAINYADGKLYYKNYLGGTSYISNQSSFDTINANNSLILATGVSDTLSFVAGDNISITTNTTTKTIEISATSGGSTSGGTYANGAFIQANAAYAHANAAFNAANTGGSSTDSVARNTANAAFIQANSAYNLANTLIGGNASFINSGTSNVFFSSANGNILANVNGNTIVTITANGIVTAGANGDISGANGIYANTLYVQNANVTNTVFANSITFNDGTKLISANGIVASTAANAVTANVAVNARITNVTTGTYFPIVTDTTITGADTFHYSSNDFLMYAANNTFRVSGNVWAGQFIAVGSNIPVVNATGHWVGQPLVANNSSTANVSNVAINARITVVNTGIYYPIVTDTTITGADTLHYSSNDFVMFAANNTFRATGNIWAVQNIAVGTNIPVVNSTGHWIGQALSATDSFARTFANSAGSYANSAYTQANTATTNAATADSKAVTAGSYANSAFGVSNSAALYANSAFVQANAAFNIANTDVTNITISSPGTYGNATYIPVITVSANGRINTISTIEAAGGGGGSGTDQFARDRADAAFIQANAAFNAANTVTSNNDATLSGTIVPLANTSDQFNIIGVTGNITIAAPAEPYFEGQKLIIRIKDAGTSVNISWNVIYRSIGTNLPTTTNPNKTAYIGFIYNTADADWDAVAISLEA